MVRDSGGGVRKGGQHKQHLPEQYKGGVLLPGVVTGGRCAGREVKEAAAGQ